MVRKPIVDPDFWRQDEINDERLSEQWSRRDFLWRTGGQQVNPPGVADKPGDPLPEGYKSDVVKVEK